MSPLQKPEWIEISDADKSASIRGISKGLPVMALVAVAAILGIGSIFAQTAEQSPASAIEIAAPVVQSSQSSESSPATVETQSAVTQTSKASFTPQGAAVVSPSAPTMKNPSIGMLPTGGGDDDDDDDEDEGDDDDEDEGDDD